MCTLYVSFNKCFSTFCHPIILKSSFSIKRGHLGRIKRAYATRIMISTHSAFFSFGHTMAMKKGCKRIITGVITYVIASGIVGLIIYGASKGRQAQEICATPQEGVALSTFCSFISSDENKSDDWVPPAFSAQPPEVKKREEPTPSRRPTTETPDYQNDEPINASPVSLQDFLSQDSAKDFFSRKTMLKSVKTPDAYFVCPRGGDRFYHCASILMKKSFYSNLKCSDFNEVNHTLACCPEELKYISFRCNSIQKDPLIMQKYMNSGELWETYFLSQELRDALQDELLQILKSQSTSKTFPSFSLFLTEFSRDAVPGTAREYRRFLQDGSLFCYSYDQSKGKGRANMVKCPKKFQGQLLDLSDLKYYRVVDKTTLMLTLPTWEEYCSSRKC